MTETGGSSMVAWPVSGCTGMCSRNSTVGGLPVFIEAPAAVPTVSGSNWPFSRTPVAKGSGEASVAVVRAKSPATAALGSFCPSSHHLPMLLPPDAGGGVSTHAAYELVACDCAFDVLSPARSGKATVTFSKVARLMISSCIWPLPQSVAWNDEGALPEKP